MKDSNASNQSVIRFMRITVLLGTLSIIGSTFAEARPVGPADEPPDAALSSSSPDPLVREMWRKNMVRTPLPGSGCFNTSYPDITWHEVQCIASPLRPFLPRHGTPSPETVGNGTDYSAEVTSGTISVSDGAFIRTADVTSESDGSANVFSLQLNATPFSSSTCNGVSGCQGWQQFIYSTGTGGSFMQYWLLNYGSPCPAGWTAASGSCYKNSTTVSVPAQTISNLINLALAGTATSGGNDTVVMSTGNNLYSTSGADSVVNLAPAWTESEFNIFGDGNGSKATFNTGATLVVRTSVDNGTTAAPTCASAGSTGETNSLTLVSPCCPLKGASPAIQFMESSATGATYTCPVPFGALLPIIDKGVLGN